MATNPSIEDHRQAVKDKIKETIAQTGSRTRLVQWKESANEVGLALAEDIVDRVISRKNYVLFSITKLTVDRKEMNIE